MRIISEILLTVFVLLASITSVNADDIESYTDEIRIAFNKQGRGPIMLKIANDFAKLLPMQIDKYTVLTSTIWTGYAYSLSSEINNTALSKLKNAGPNTVEQYGRHKHGELITGYCTDPVTRSILNNDVTIEYDYSAENGQYLFGGTIKKHDCIK